MKPFYGALALKVRFYQAVLLLPIYKRCSFEENEFVLIYSP